MQPYPNAGSPPPGARMMNQYPSTPQHPQQPQLNPYMQQSPYLPQMMQQGIPPNMMTPVQHNQQQQMHNQQAQYAIRQREMQQQQQTPTRPPPQQQRAVYQSPANQPPPAKRARPTPSTAQQEAVEDEEDTSRGDILDSLTPREISEQRFTQHDAWMEEVLGSAYAVSQIMPGKLGLENLPGDLKSLTEGLYNPDGSPVDGKARDEAAKIVGERAKAKTAEIEAEMEEMMRKHQRAIEKIKKGTLLMRAERELRGAGIVDIEEYLGLKPKSTPMEEDEAAPRSIRTVEEIVADMEKNYGVTIKREMMVQQVNTDGSVFVPPLVVKEDDAMDGITVSQHLSPGNGRALIPVVQQVASAPIPPPVLVAPQAEEDMSMADTSMMDVDIPETMTGAAFTPSPAPSAGLSAPQLVISRSPSPLPSPLPAIATPQATASTPTPVPDLQHISHPPTSADEPPTVPDEDSNDVLEGAAGGDLIPEGFTIEDSAGEAFNLLGEETSNFADALGSVGDP